MAEGKFNLQEERVLNWLKGTAFPAPPSAVYVGLFTVAPAEDGTTGTEVSGGGYARQAVTFGAVSQLPSGPAQMSNTADINFPVATAPWGTIVAIGLFDASTAGNLLYYASISPVPINTNDQIRFLAGNLTVRED
jgi:hypothetical protein